eukprot:m.12359 g.12359  ORF g.12359 m.12359 type:complete len:495 (+) comp2940_c1_seq1:2491-3975(+)
MADPAHDAARASVDDEDNPGQTAVLPTSPEPRYLYDWQRPSDAYKESLLARQAELRDLNLEGDPELLAEWFALVAEVDRLIRDEHSVRDNLDVQSCQYYKEVLLARQAELREMDLASNAALMIEWFTLIKELDYVVRRQAVLEGNTEADKLPVDQLLREGKVKIKQGLKAPGGTRYTAASRLRTSQTSQTSQGPDTEHAVDTVEPSHDDAGPPDVFAPSTGTTENTSQAVDPFGFSVAAATGANLSGMAASSANTDGSALEPPPTVDLVSHRIPRPGSEPLSPTEFAMLPAGDRVRALLDSPEPEDTDRISQWLDLLDKPHVGNRVVWLPPTIAEIQKSLLPSWILDDTEFLHELTSDLRELNLNHNDGAAASSVTGQRHSREADLKRRIAEKEEEIRAAYAQLELGSSKEQLARDKSALTTVDDVGQRADMTMELLDRELELESQEKELEADELVQDIQDLDGDLEKARLAMLKNPLITEIVDRSAMNDSSEC